MVLLMNSFFEAFDLFEVATRTFATPSWGEYENFFEIQPNKYNLSHCHTPPLSPSILEGELTHSCLTILVVTIET